MQAVQAATRSNGEISLWRAMLAGCCASLVGIGLARFAYTPLIPVLIAEHWFTPAQADYLGATNLAGYLVGALCARRMSASVPVTMVLRGMMVLATASFFAAAHPFALPWSFAWRFIAGVSGGALMVLAALAVLPHVAPYRRGLAAGAIFTGVGLGIAASGVLVPWLLRFGLAATWNGLGILSLALTTLAWGGWPRTSGGRHATATKRGDPHLRASAALKALYVEYGLNAVGLVPHMIFLVDFIVRGLEQGLVAGARYWVIFGVGAVVGPLLVGLAADRVGFRAALRLAFLAQALAVALAALADAPVALAVSSAVVGAFVPGVVSLTLGRLHELVDGDRARQHAWSICTVAFAFGQAAAAYAFSYVFAQTGEAYGLLFAAGSAALLLALAIDLIWGRTSGGATS